jgi:hypothetical protein
MGVGVAAISTRTGVTGGGGFTTLGRGGPTGRGRGSPPLRFFEDDFLLLLGFPMMASGDVGGSAVYTLEHTSCRLTGSYRPHKSNEPKMLEPDAKKLKSPGSGMVD